MTREQVDARVRQIQEFAYDPEHAHELEDALWRDVLVAVASGWLDHRQCRDLAAAALTTRDVEFERWRA